MSEEVKSIFLDNISVRDDQIVDHDLTKSWKTIFGTDNPNINNDSLVAYWRLNDITGTDSSGNGHAIDWTSSAPTLTPETPFKNKNNTVLFNGTSNYGTVADSIDLTFVDDPTGTPSDKPFSISCWVKPGDCPLTSRFGIVSKENEYNFYIKNRSTDPTIKDYSVTLQLVHDPSRNAYEYVLDTEAITEGSWFNIVVSYNGAGLSATTGTDPIPGINFYVNGVYKDHSEQDGFETGTYIAMPDTTNDMIIGRYNSFSSTYIEGMLSELAIWNRELTNSEAKALYDVRYGVTSHSFTSYSPRVMLRDSDNKRGEYFTTSRMGDKDRTGRFNTSFNDLNVVKFGYEASVYPGELNRAFTIKDGNNLYSYESNDSLVSHWRTKNIELSNAATALGYKKINSGSLIKNSVLSGPTGGFLSGIYKSESDPYFSDFTSEDKKIHANNIDRSSNTSFSFAEDTSGINIGTAATWDAIIGNDSSGGSTRLMTLSAWVNISADSSGNSRIIDFGDSYVSLYINDSTDKIYFITHWGAPPPIPPTTVIWETDTSITTDEWFNVFCVYDATSDINDPEIYVNGVSLAITKTVSAIASAQYHGIDDGSTPINSCFLGNSNSLSADFNGSIADVAIWNSLLTADEVKAIYLNDSQWYPVQENTVQYPLGLPVADTKLPDIVTDIVAPGIVQKGHGDRSFNITTLGEDISAFNDERIHTDTSAFYMTGTSLDVYPGFDSPLKSKVAFHFDITADEEQYIFRQNSEHAAVNEDDPLYDSNADIPGSPLTGQDFTGFCYYSPTKKKWEQIGLIDPYTTTPRFFDYSYSNQEWHSAGLSPGQWFPMQFAGTSGFVLQEQTLSLLDTFDTLEKRLFAIGYNKIGMPTVSAFAPFGVQYHATSSQVTKASDFIDSPFLLEKITIDLPVYSRHLITELHDRTRDLSNYVVFLYLQRRSTTNDPDSILDPSALSSERTLIGSSSICFYNPKVLTYDFTSDGTVSDFVPIHETGFIHAFDIKNAGTFPEIGEFDGNIKLEFTPSVHNSSVVRDMIPTSSIENMSDPYMQFWPGGDGCLPFTVNGSKTFSSKDANIDLTAPASTTTFVDSWTLGSPPTPKTWHEISNQNGSIYEEHEGNLQEKNTNMSIHKNVERHFKNYGSELMFDSPTTGIPFIDDQVSYLKKYAHASPFLMLPGDEIILAIEKTTAGDRIGDGTETNLYFTSGSWGLKSKSSLSGSLLKIKAEPASMTFFGSQIKENKEYINTVNQDLTSLSVHEAIYSEDVVDQFDIEPVTMKSGSYTDVLMENDFSYIGPTSSAWRRVTASAAAYRKLSSKPRYSLQRNVMHYSKNERFYDTMLPDSYEYCKNSSFYNSDYSSSYIELLHTYVRIATTGVTVHSDLGVIVHNNETISNPGQVGVTDADSYDNFLPFVMSFPFENNSSRNDKDYQFLVHDGAGAGSPVKNKQIRNMLFTEGFLNTHVIADNQDQFGQTGGGIGFKHGVRNTTQIHTHATFRHDRYGQFRDMLEQRQFGIFIKTKKNELSSTDDDLYDKKSTFNVTKRRAPVTCMFVETNSEKRVSDPNVTSSSNLSKFATSSLPYFDDFDTYNSGNGRNRVYSADLLQLNETKISSNAVLDFSFDPTKI